LNLSSDEGQRFTSRFLNNRQSTEGGDTKLPCILLIEDNEADSFLVEQALVENDVRAELMVLRDGEEAVEFIDAVDNGRMKCPDLIVLDLNLPKKSGHEVLAKMRSADTCREVPVVVLSSSVVLIDTNESKRLGARLGVVRHIQKPANLEQFIRVGAVLKAVLSGGGTPM
jgi:chemotaxis family two-component system response regulator Rcp1